jgi:hypothetical protein
MLNRFRTTLAGRTPVPAEEAAAAELRFRVETVKLAALARSFGLRQLEPRRPVRLP